MKTRLSKRVSMPALAESLRRYFDRLRDDRSRCAGKGLQDYLMAAFGVFSLKYPSLLAFDDDGRHDEGKAHNLKKLYGLREIPSDTQMRERLDQVDPRLLRGAFKRVFALVQHAKLLEGFQFYDEHYLIAVDGTGYFSSNEVYCKNCCEKRHHDGSVTYYHQMLSGVIVHPDMKVVLPICPEPILKQDGHTKNDCERNAAKRLISDLRREHPKLKIIITEDALSSNNPHIQCLREHKMSFILGVKPKDHTWLFDWVRAYDFSKSEYTMTKEGFEHRFRYVNDVRLNDQPVAEQVNFLEYFEKNLKTGKTQHFTWVTDIPLDQKNVYQIMKGGRARWKIENETFNTLKNQGYHFEHNFGHGKKHLSTVFAYMMFLAFLVDQIQQLSCPLFQKALQRFRAKKCMWQEWLANFYSFLFESWDEFLLAMAHGIIRQKPILRYSG